MLSAIRGFIYYHLIPRKTVVVIRGSMRSGTTLLKALLAEAPDVSSLPEFKHPGFERLNIYARYCRIFHLSKKRIIVLKTPGYTELPFDAKFLLLKIIVITRNAADAARSIVKMTRVAKECYPEPWDEERAFGHWRFVYERIVRDEKMSGHDVTFIKYEDLIENPAGITKELFHFIGSRCDRGYDSYKVPATYRWVWGMDDGGDKIKTLRVQKGRAADNEEDVLSGNAAQQEPVAGLLKVLGY